MRAVSPLSAALIVTLSLCACQREISIPVTQVVEAGVTVSVDPNLTTSETGTQISFDVVLDGRPTKDAAIALLSSDTTEGLVVPSVLTFTPENFDEPQTATVTGVDDNVVDGDQVFSIVIAPIVSQDSNYHGFDPTDIGVTNQDNDVAEIVVDPTVGLVTTEAGTTAIFSVVLTVQPSNDVSVSLSSSDPTEVSVSPTRIVFTSPSWETPVTVTVTGVDDAVDDGDQAAVILIEPAVSDDWAFDGFDAADVVVTNQDDDTAGISANPTSGLVTTEAGDTATFTVVLATEPLSGVTIGLSSSDDTEGAVSPSSVAFTNLNWFTAQTVTVTGIDDAVADGNQVFDVVTAPAASTDPAFNGRVAANVSVTNQDDDTASISLTPTTGLVTTEAGGTASFSIVLSAEPMADVTFSFSSSDPSEGTVNPSSVIFTSTNWNNPCTVTVTGQDDYIADGSVSYTIVTSTAATADAAYNNQNPADVAVTNTDNDVAGIVLSTGATINTSESSGNDSFTIVLSSQPTADVAIALASSDPTEGSVGPASVTFSIANWNTPQTVTVYGVNDSIVDCNIAYTVTTAPAVSTDTNYGGMDANDIAAINADNESNPGYYVSCDGDSSNGCEANLTADKANCSSCGHSCGSAGICLSSTCMGYVTSTPVVAFVNACDTPEITYPSAVGTDDGVTSVTLPFPFSLYGSTPTTSAWMNTNGVLGIGGTVSNSYQNRCIPSPSSPALSAIYSFWCDLYAPADSICTATLGVAPNRTFVTTWNAVYHLNQPTLLVTFSAILTEGQTYFDVVFDAMASDGGTYTLGVQDNLGTTATQVNCSAIAPPAQDTAYRFSFEALP